MVRAQEKFGNHCYKLLDFVVLPDFCNPKNKKSLGLEFLGWNF